MITPHPIQYQGSKRNLAPDILSYFPAGFERLIEPFAGSGALSIAAAVRGIASRFWLNDLNKPLVDLLSLMVNQTDELANDYQRIWRAQLDDPEAYYLHVRDEFNQSQDPRLFLYLLARCVKGSVRYNADGKFNQSADKRRLGTRPETMRKNMVGVSQVLHGKTIFSALDYREVLADATRNDVIYMDPPYQGVCGDRDSRYFAGVNYDEFVGALEDLNARQIPFLISYDGRTGDREYGQPLPAALNLTRIELEAGRSTQATLLGRNHKTVESLYLSSGLTPKTKQTSVIPKSTKARQLWLPDILERYEKISERVS